MRSSGRILTTKVISASIAIVSLFQVACTSQEDKARIRLAASAYLRASDERRGRADGHLMTDLQRAIDVVPDGKARDELVKCHRLLENFRLIEEAGQLDYEHNLDVIGHGGPTTTKQRELAMSKAKQANPLPDLKLLGDCYVTIQDLAN